MPNVSSLFIFDESLFMLTIKYCNIDTGQLVYVKMRYLILILCLLQFKVEASDWLNRTVRVDLIVNRKNFDTLQDLYERSERMTSVVEATNGQYPWSVMTTAWIFQGGIGIGVTCSCSIISKNYALSNLRCVGWK